MRDIAGKSFLADPESPVDLLRMDESELAEWAGHKTVGTNSDTPLMRIGAVVFWTIVTALVLTRIFLISPEKLRPTLSSTGAASSAFDLIPSAKL